MFHHAVAERFSLSVTDLKTLDILHRRGQLSAGEIAHQTTLATASVTSLIDRLEKKRLVRRLRDSVDRRRVVVRLTPNLEKFIAPLFQSLSRRLLARFRRYPGEHIVIIDQFLTSSARDLREETARLATGRPRRRSGAHTWAQSPLRSKASQTRKPRQPVLR